MAPMRREPIRVASKRSVRRSVMAPDAGVFTPEQIAEFLEAAQTRQWAREPKLRTLAKPVQDANQVVENVARAAGGEGTGKPVQVIKTREDDPYKALKTTLKAEIDQEVERAKQQLRERVAELAVAGAEKILRKEVNASAHAAMLTALKQDL